MRGAGDASYDAYSSSLLGSLGAIGGVERVVIERGARVSMGSVASAAGLVSIGFGVVGAGGWYVEIVLMSVVVRAAGASSRVVPPEGSAGLGSTFIVVVSAGSVGSLLLIT